MPPTHARCSVRFLFISISITVVLISLACARSVANASNDTTATQNTAVQPAGANIAPIPTPPPNEEVPRITLADAKKAFDDGTGYFIDARPADAYNDEHIKGAVNITYDKLDAHIKELKTKQKIIVYCS